MTLSEQARQQMISQQLRCWSVLDEQVLHTMATVPRELFVPDDYQALAFADTSIPTQVGITIPAPKIEGRLLQALALNPSDQVLVIGAGNGYLLACISRLARQVHCIEPDPKVAAIARSNLLKVSANNVSIVVQDPQTDHATYDAILVTGSIAEYDMLHERALSHGGRMVIITGQSPVMQVFQVIRTGDNQWHREVLFETDIPPMNPATKPSAFVF
jgi:protein-L-isoaspartate(D-aspartate) O-methyltransferase